MKHTITLLIINILCFPMWSQTTDVITGLNQPTSVDKIGNTIYYGEFNGNLRMFDVNDVQAGTTQITDTDGIYRTTLRGDELYFTELNMDRISSINITEVLPSPSSFLREAIRPVGITSDEEFIYFSELRDDRATISKVPIDDPDSPIIIYSTFDGATALCKRGDLLYFIDDIESTILRFDVTQAPIQIEEIASGFENPTDILCAGDMLFISDFESGDVLQIDLSLPNMPVTNIIAGLDGPTGLFLEGNDLYVSVFFENKIIKHTLQTVRVNNVENDNVKVFPNPTSDYLQLIGFTDNRKYDILDLTGKSVKSGSIGKESRIDLRNLIQGNYNIVLDNGTTASFIKN